MAPHGDNQEYIEKLQQEIRNLRSEYAAKTRQSPSVKRSLQSETVRPVSPINFNNINNNNIRNINNNSSSRPVDTFVKRSFWEDLARVKERIVKRNMNLSSSSKNKDVDDDEVRDVWYRTSRRYSDSKVRRSIRKKAREKTVTKIKSSSWSHNPSTRRDLQIKIKARNNSAQGNHNKSSSYNRKQHEEKDSGVYKEILDMVNVNSQKSRSFENARMAQWLMSSKPYCSEDI